MAFSWHPAAVRRPRRPTVDRGVEIDEQYRRTPMPQPRRRQEVSSTFASPALRSFFAALASALNWARLFVQELPQDLRLLFVQVPRRAEAEPIGKTLLHLPQAFPDRERRAASVLLHPLAEHLGTRRMRIVQERERLARGSSWWCCVTVQLSRLTASKLSNDG